MNTASQRGILSLDNTLRTSLGSNTDLTVRLIDLNLSSGVPSSGEPSVPTTTLESSYASVMLRPLMLDQSVPTTVSEDAM